MRNASVVRMTGPLAAYTDGFRGYLAGLGYAPSSAQDQLRLMADVSRWLDGQAADASGLTTERIAEFLRTRRGSYVRLVSGRALAPMLGFLRGLAVTPPQPAPVPGTRVDQLVEAYRRYLCDERGLDPVIEVDGGLSGENAWQVLDAGANAIVAGSHVFHAPDYVRAIASIRSSMRSRS